MPNKKHHPWVLTVAILGLLGVAYWAHWANSRHGGQLVTPALSGAAVPGKPAGGMPLPVETVRAEAAELTLDATAVGSLRSNESVILRPETAGRIATINFRDGTAVGRGSVLVGLDAAMQGAEYDQAKASLGLAQMNVKRTRELFEKKFVSQQALDNAEAALKVQEAALALAEAKLEKTRLKAPFAGVVGIRNVSIGDYVKEGQELVNIEDIGTLKIDFRLPESYLGQLKTGQMLEVSTDALPGQTFAARLEAINPLVDTAGRAISCRAQLSNAEGRLRPGMFVRVRLIFETRGNVLMVPEQAIVPDMKSPFVYRVRAGKAERAPVVVVEVPVATESTTGEKPAGAAR
ncbi:efflux RND transporter periplasmic adaptor subunit [Propionivibrio limicola]|uniref:efflux RND transporter periplasmic adaptor subunit n=1 Tax=Propionivibrio limicola TaxID=167645 RepID=UPI001290AE2D|nr:efflux RND transporter periplasmic adaptor subunit [Propionivibrio limicola]